MEQNIISLKSIEDFKTERIRFYIPQYQRGYRWKKKQVSQLIDDIASFIPTEKNPFYFLQALAVAKDSKSQKVNVVDGQQRLTTIKLILGEDSSIMIDYAREADKALDKHFKDSATDVIKEKLGDIGDHRRVEFCEKLKGCCRFLYYEVSQEKELTTFDELNSGKIPAKDSELVKCVMLTLGKDEPIALTNSRANEWDEMERRLNDEDFFAFITPRNTWREEDRMTILLRYAGMVPSNEEIEEEVFPFLSMIQKKLKKESRETVWKTICTAYYRLIEWYNDPIMYHALGAVVHKRDNKKNTIISIVGDNSILDTIKAMKNYSPDEKGDDYHGWGETLFNYLLLSNMAFCWKRWPNRYDFQKHRQVEVWSMEHIFARNQKDLDEDELKDWLGKDNIEEEFKQYKKTCTEGKGDEWLAGKLGDKYPTEEDHSIKNLALLPQNANSALNNKLFEGKRSSICQWENDSWGNYWVPPVTEAAFLKSLVGLKMHLPFWSQEDKPAYMDAQKENIKSFIENLEKIERI